MQSGGLGAATAVTVNDNASFNVFNVSTNSTLTVASLTLGTSAGASIGIGLNGANPSVNPITVTNTLTEVGLTTINVSNSSTQQNGTFPLIAYTTYSGPTIASAFQLGPTRIIGTLQFTTGLISLNVTGTDSIVWTGVNSTNWDAGTAINVGGTINWALKSNSLTTTNFVAGDSVIFDDSSSGAVTPGTVTLNQVVQPASVTFNNNLIPYTLSGTGSIADGATAATLTVSAPAR